MHVRVSCAALLLVLVALGDARGICKDPGSPPDPFLDALDKPLDKAGLDYRRRWSGLVSPDPARPELGRLSGYPAESKPFIHPSWQEGFDKSLRLNNSLMAIPETRASAGTSVSEFIEAWHRTPKEARVFVSYTRADRAHAMQVQAVLESRGYKVFTYLGSGGSPSFPPEAVGQMFRSAGHHFVIDTPSSRQSIGVTLEAHSMRAVEARAKAAALEAAKAQPKAVPAESSTPASTKPETRPRPVRPATVRPRSPSCVDCYCGGRYLGCLSPAACIPGTPCG